ncbi:MAG: AMP phosphorylase [Candidatus Pacearchaeota archaeon]
MKLKIKRLFIITGKPVCMIHEKTAKNLSLHVGDRVLIKKNSKEKIISTIDIVKGLIKPGEIGISEEIFKILGLKNKDAVSVELSERPRSIELIKKKLSGEKLSKDEINEIVQNISNNSLTEVEVAFFVSAVYTHELSIEETLWLTEAMVNSGNRLNLLGKVVDKHCIGGVAGNRTTPIIVSICAEKGLIMPKTSSRAITSAAGTADTIETIAKVDFSIDEIKKIIKKTNACFVWGGTLGLAPVDDKIIKIEKIANIDSYSQLLASILSKKISVGSKYLLIDIPFGNSAKVNKRQAKKLKKSFIKLARKFKISIDVELTDGSEPIGNGVGPALEIKDVIKVLRREPTAPKDLEEKSIYLAGKLLELSEVAKKGEGIKIAREILDSGKAFKKFQDIINAQNGKINIIKKAEYLYPIKSNKKLKILHIDNKFINSLARKAGCPEDKFAGVYLDKKRGDTVEKNEVYLTIHSESKEKLKNAINFYEKNYKNNILFDRT